MNEKSITRRDLLKGAAVAGLALGAPALLSPADALASIRGTNRVRRSSADSVTWLTYALYSDPKLTKAFTQQSGISIKPDNFGELPEMETKLRSGAGDDVVSIASNLVGPLAAEGLLLPLDTSRLKNWKRLYPQFSDANFIRYKGKVYGAPTVWGPEGLIYRTDKLKNVNSWDVLWDQANKGRLSVIDYDYEMALVGALYLGMKKQLAGSPIKFSSADLAKIKSALSEQIKLDSKVWSDTAVAESLLASGESVATIGRISFLNDLRKKNVPVKLINPKEGTQGWVTSTCIVKSSKNVDGAYKLLDYAISPGYGLPLAQTYGYPATSSAVMSKIPAAQRKELFLNDPAILEKMYFWKPAPQQAQITQMWNEIKASA